MQVVLKIVGVLVLVLVLVLGGVALTLKANFPTNTVDVKPLSQTPATSDLTSILIFGGTRNTGLMVARRMKTRGDHVTAFVRPTSDTAALKNIDVDMVVGDAMDIETVRAALSGNDYQAVLTTVACLRCNPPPDYQANANIIRAANEAGIKRLVLVTSIGAGDSAAALPALSARILAKTLPLKTRAEEDLSASGLSYTIIRPGGLRSGRQTGNGVLSEDRNAFGYIFREDLAKLIVSVLDDPGTIGKTLVAIDSKREFPWDND